MAELVLKVGDRSPDPADYKDGDILCAFNRREIRCVYAQHICWPTVNGRKLAGELRETQPLLEMLLASTQEYRWEQVSKTEVKRTNLWTKSEIVYGVKPAQDPDRPWQMIYCDINEWIARRLKGGCYPLFGEAGGYRFYLGDGRCDYSNERLDVVWNEIEIRTPHRESQYARWPAGTEELKSTLFVPVDDFDDEKAIELTAPETEEDKEGNVVLVQQRTHKIDWQNDLGLTAQEKTRVLDRAVEVDLRISKATYARQTLTRVKDRRSLASGGRT